MLSTNPVTSNLIKARELIADEKNWGRADTSGKRCALEALGSVVGWRWTRADGPELALLALAAQELLKTACTTIHSKPRNDYEQVYTINDHFGHTVTMRMFDRAIQLSLTETA